MTAVKRGDNRHKRCRRKRESIMQNRIPEPLMQEIGDNTDHNPAQHAHFLRVWIPSTTDRPTCFIIAGSASWSDGQVIVDAHVHQHIADKTSKGADHALLRFASPNGICHGKHHRQIW